MRRAVVALALAAVATGLALSLILIGNGPGASGLVGGHYWIVVFVCASVVVGWLAAQLIRTPLIALLSPAAVLVVIGIVMFVKRSEEHTSELQSRPHLVCRLLLE